MQLWKHFSSQIEKDSICWMFKLLLFSKEEVTHSHIEYDRYELFLFEYLNVNREKREAHLAKKELNSRQWKRMEKGNQRHDQLDWDYRQKNHSASIEILIPVQSEKREIVLILRVSYTSQSQERLLHIHCTDYSDYVSIISTLPIAASFYCPCSAHHCCIPYTLCISFI